MAPKDAFHLIDGAPDALPLHPVSKEVGETDFGTREFAVLDQDGNLISFFEWVEP